jgi:anti-sigma factor RsiW
VTEQALDHEAAAKLLPWLVNGSLAIAERHSVEAHVRSCIVCRRELKELERLDTAVRAQPLVHLSSESGLNRLDAQLDREAGERLARRERLFTPVLRFAAVASIGVAFLGTLLWLAPSLPNQTGYSTLATSPADQRAQLDLIFDQQTSAADIQALLQSIDGEIVAGPSALGRYGVRIRGTQVGDEQLAALLDRLARDPHVRFAGRSFTESGQ